AIWALIYNPNARFQPHADRSPEWNRGAYLVEAMGHCGECHTERNIAEALNNRRKFGGGIADGWHAYNITPDKASGIGAWSDGEIADYTTYGHAEGRGSAGGPMVDVVDANLRDASPSDFRAVLAYLRSIPPVSSGDLPAPRPTVAADSPRSEVAGFDVRGKH